MRKAGRQERSAAICLLIFLSHVFLSAARCCLFCRRDRWSRPLPVATIRRRPDYGGQAGRGYSGNSPFRFCPYAVKKEKNGAGRSPAPADYQPRPATAYLFPAHCGDAGDRPWAFLGYRAGLPMRPAITPLGQRSARNQHQPQAAAVAPTPGYDPDADRRPAAPGIVEPRTTPQNPVRPDDGPVT